MSRVDAEIGVLMDFFAAKSGLIDSTLHHLTSDHGEEMGREPLASWAKAVYFDGSYHVPPHHSRRSAGEGGRTGRGAKVEAFTEHVRPSCLTLLEADRSRHPTPVRWPEMIASRLSLSRAAQPPTLAGAQRTGKFDFPRRRRDRARRTRSHLRRMRP